MWRRDCYRIAPPFSHNHTLKYRRVGSCVTAHDIPRFISMYQQGMLAVDRLQPTFENRLRP
jgi:Zn-dependent alcohol dehydrogenase